LGLIRQKRFVDGAAMPPQQDDRAHAN
jgi:hypothetical protein